MSSEVNPVQSFIQNLHYTSNQKASFLKIIQSGYFVKRMSSEVNHVPSFFHNLNYTSNQKASLIKIIQSGYFVKSC